MGFNLGAFAGGLAQSGMSTYQMMSDIERKDKEMALRQEEAARAKEQFGWSRAEQEEKNKIREAAGVYGGVGGANYAPELQRTAGIGAQQAQGLAVNTGIGGEDFDRAVNESTQGALRENAQRQGAVVPTSAEMKPATYTREQADADYLKRVAAINPERALEIEGKQTQTAIGRSALKRTKAEDDYSEWLQTSQQQVAADPVGFLKDNLSAYNNAKKGSHLDDGKTAEVVPSADGKTFSFVQKDSKGKVLGSTPIDQTTAAEALKHIAFDKYTALPGKFLEARKQATAERGVDIQGQELAAKLKVDLFGAQADQAKGAASASRAHAMLYSNMATLSKSNAAAGEIIKPYLEKYSALTPAQQAGEEGQAVLLQAATAAAKKTGDITGIINALKKPDRAAVTAEERTAAYKELGEAGTDPAAVKAVKAKWPGVFGPSALDKAIADKTEKDKNKPAPEANTEKPTSALPTKKTATPDFSVKGGRGVYTVSGLPSTYKTKADAEKAAQEAQKKRREAEVSSALERD
jgi:hypothetical protein